MERGTLNHVDVLMVDPDLNSRSVLKSVLGSSGFRNLHVGNSMGDLNRKIADSVPDLLICDCHLPDGDFFDFVSRVRHHEVGRNPFVAIIAMTRNPNPEIVRRVSDCGADHLVVKPYSTAQMTGRIMQLVESRKLFVVTSDYIGPERRVDPTRASKVQRMRVPNTLKAKVMGQTDSDAIQRAVDMAIADVNIRKLERYDDEIAFLVERIVPELEQRRIDESVRRFLDRLLYVTEDTGRRLIGTKYAHVSELCQSLRTVVNGIVAAGTKPAPRDIQLLRPLSQAIQVGFGTSQETVAAAHEISVEALSHFRHAQAEKAATAKSTTAYLAEGRRPAQPDPAAAPARPTPPATPAAVAAPRAPVIAGQGFDGAFVESLCDFIAQRLEPWFVPDVAPPVPFMLSPVFAQRLLDGLRTQVASAIPGTRRLVVLAQSLKPEEITADFFRTMFTAASKDNVARFLWNNWWDNVAQALAPGADIGKPTIKDARRFWDGLQQGAAKDGYDPPRDDDIALFRALFDYDPQGIRNAMLGVRQVLQHEATGHTLEGASRNFILTQIESQPPHCGEMIALWTYFTQEADFSPAIQKSFVASTGMYARDRRQKLPFYLRWAPDPLRRSAADSGSAAGP